MLYPYLRGGVCKCTTYICYVQLLLTFATYRAGVANVLLTCPTFFSVQSSAKPRQSCKACQVLHQKYFRVFSYKNRSRSSRERAAPNLVANRRIFAEFCNILAEISPTINRFHQRLTDFTDDLQISSFFCTVPAGLD